MRTALLYGVLAAYLVVTVYPLVWMAGTGLRAEGEIAENVWSLPAPPRWENLREVWRAGNFRRAYLNSVVVSVASGALSVAVAALAGYAFARLRFRGREVLFYAFLLGMMIPVHVTLIPLNRLLQAMGLRTTYLALIGPYVGFALPLSTFILRGFFERVPVELEDAARIDGCSALGVFWHVALPSARPALATVVIFNFVTMWNEFVFALTFLRRSDLRTIPLALWEFSDEAGLVMSKTCAAMTISVLPLLAVFFLAQKHIIQGLTAGALKQ
jgi:raffinose/stachyose/melibiose transport system permease protein